MDIRNYFQPKPREFAPKMFPLDHESYIEQGPLPQSLRNYDFQKLWCLHPEEYGEVKYMGKIVKTPRWQQSYLNSYIYSGMQHEALPLPNEFQPFLDWANTIDPDIKYNQVVINWYANGHHSIGPHSDNEKQLVKHSPVLAISLGQERILRVRCKRTNDQVIDVPMPSNTYLVMGGKMQERYLHEIPKVNGMKGAELGKRISITFRVFAT